MVSDRRHFNIGPGKDNTGTHAVFSSAPKASRSIPSHHDMTASNVSPNGKVPVGKLVNVVKAYPMGNREYIALRGVEPDPLRRRVHGHSGAFGQRQVHYPQYGNRHRPSLARTGIDGR